MLASSLAWAPACDTQSEHARISYTLSSTPCLEETRVLVHLYACAQSGLLSGAHAWKSPPNSAGCESLVLLCISAAAAKVCNP